MRRLTVVIATLILVATSFVVAAVHDAATHGAPIAPSPTPASGTAVLSAWRRNVDAVGHGLTFACVGDQTSHVTLDHTILDFQPAPNTSTGSLTAIMVMAGPHRAWDGRRVSTTFSPLDGYVDDACLVRVAFSATPIGVITTSGDAGNLPQGVEILTPAPSGSGLRVRVVRTDDISKFLTFEDVDGAFTIVSTNLNLVDQWAGYPQVAADPLLLYQFRDDDLVDVTRDYPALILRDADMWWHRGWSTEVYPEAMFASWVADECELGYGAAAWRLITSDVLAGRLTTLSESDRAYIRSLRSALVVSGFCPPRQVPAVT